MVSNKIPEEKRQRIAEERESGTSIRKTAQKLDVSRPTVRKYQDYNSEDTVDSTQESEGSGENSPDKLIKSHDNTNEVQSMTENNEDDGSEDYENICGNCGEKFNGTPDKCPGCNAPLDFDQTIEL